MKGAVERVLDKCKTSFQDGSSVYMTTAKRQEIMDAAHELGTRGLRGEFRLVGSKEMLELIKIKKKKS